MISRQNPLHELARRTFSQALSVGITLGAFGGIFGASSGAVTLFFPQPTQAAQAKSSCEDVFGPSVFPPGYKINAHDFKIALAIPQAREFLLALKEAIHVFEDHEKKTIGVLVFRPSYVASESKRLQRIKEGEHPEFPEAFFRTYLASKVTDETVLRKEFDRLFFIVEGTKPSSEALLLLAYVAMKLPQAPPTSQTDAHDGSAFNINVARSIPAALIRLNDQKRLPLLYDFFKTANNDLFAILAMINRSDVIDQLPAEYRSFATLTSEEYGKLVKQTLDKLDPSISLEEKAVIARNLMERTLPRPSVNIFAAVLAKQVSVTNIDRWRYVASMLFDHLVTQSLPGDKPYHSPDEIHADFDAFVNQVAGGKDSPHSKFLRSVFATALKMEYNERNPDVGTTERRLTAELTALAVEGKRIVEDFKDAQKAQQAESIKAKVAQQQASASAQVAKKKPTEGREVSIGRTARQAMAAHPQPQLVESAKQELSAAVGSEGSEAVIPSANEPTAGSKPAVSEAFRLSNLTTRYSNYTGLLQSIDSSQEYWFPNFNSSSQGSEPVAMERVQYVVFSKKVLENLLNGHQGNFPQWVRAFLKGPVGKKSDGLKKLKRAKGQAWEIKIAVSSFRIIVVYQKSSKTWEWLAVVHHNDVDNFVTNNGL